MLLLDDQYTSAIWFHFPVHIHWNNFSFLNFHSDPYDHIEIEFLLIISIACFVVFLVDSFLHHSIYFLVISHFFFSSLSHSLLETANTYWSDYLHSNSYFNFKYVQYALHVKQWKLCVMIRHVYCWCCFVIPFVCFVSLVPIVFGFDDVLKMKIKSSRGMQKHEKLFEHWI